jgi:hypothetical protein
VRIRTHRWGPVRLEAFGEVRYMPGWEHMRILELLVKLAGLDLGRMPDPAGLAEAKLAWWQAAAGARLGVRTGPFDATLDAGALWARLALAYSLLERGRVLQELVADGAEMDPDGRLVIEQHRPFARLTLSVTPVEGLSLEASAAGVPTSHGMAHGLTLGMRWSLR